MHIENIEIMAGRLLKFWMCFLVALNAQFVHGDMFANVTILQSALQKGAVCLDGSPPAYAYVEGFGEGAANWIVFIQGGAWCHSIPDCLGRSNGSLGSSRFMPSNIIFLGILDRDNTFNPEFYNWNMFYILYCDGSLFMSNIEKVDPNNNLTFRGARIFEVMMEEMLLKGMGNAHNVILTGGSAGGLAAILHCDNFRALFPDTCRVKCLSDSGFFIRGKDNPGADLREQRFANVVATHELANSLPASCTSKMNPGLCLFPENLVEDIQTPLFLLESAFDEWQIKENLIRLVGGTVEWSNCTTNLSLCNSTQLGIMKDFRRAFVETLQKLDYYPSRGMFVHSCFRHVHIHARDGWMCSSVVGNNVLANKTIGQAVSDWYFDRSSFLEIDTENDSPRNCTNTFGWQLFNQKCLATLPHNGSKINN